MSDQIQFEGVDDEHPAFFSLVKVKDIKAVYNLNSIEEHFGKELKTLALEDLLQVDASIKSIMQLIQKMRPNMVIITKDSSFICVDTEVILGNHIALRNKKLIATGTYEEMQRAVQIKIQKEWSNKFDRLSYDEIDEQWLKNFGTLHYKNENMYKIIKL